MSNKIHLKILQDNGIHHGYQYVNGSNKISGKLYFTDPENCWRFFHYGSKIALVTLPNNDPELEMINISKGKYAANHIILGTKYNLDDPETFKLLETLGLNTNRNYILIWALDQGYLDVIKYLVSKIIITNKHVDIFNKYIINCINKNQNDVAIYLFKLIKLSNSQCISIFEKIAHNNNLKLIRELILIMDFNYGAFDKAFKIAARMGFIDIMKCLVVNGYTYHHTSNYLVTTIIEENKLDILKFFFEIYRFSREQCFEYLSLSARNNYKEISDFIHYYLAIITQINK
ncbi:ankyrin repeat protein [Megavirus baoshan]|uniref:Ankyrin repeat protein n=1 Tax=Megavirus baoshan TaxID=2496520 RepID=A0A3Q8U8H6_9VIRU|nr:ankyrin repeat protein [Megavirus baoshan]AZL89764.1 ankyrin repeat protein [Megavirus baoshan]